MSANIRRLACDLGPWVWVWVAFMLCANFVLDDSWLIRANARLSFVQIVMLYLIAAFGAQKVPLWRLLPVTRTEIDRARWWQGIGGPALLIWGTGLAAALTMATLGHLRAAWADIVAILLAQSSFSVLLAAMTFVGIPLAAGRFGRWSVILLIPLAIPFFAMSKLQDMPQFPAIVLTMDAVGLLVAAALYLTTGRWPRPLTSLVWNLPAGGAAASRSASNKLSGPRGWPALILALLPLLAVLWMTAIGVLVLLSWMMPKAPLGIFIWLMCVAGSQMSVSMVVIAMRNLRSLPLSGARLTLRLACLLLLVQAASLLTLQIGLTATGEPAVPPLYALVALASSLLFLPIGLRFGLRVMRFITPLSLVLFIPQELLSHYASDDPWLMVGAIAMMAASLVWSYWEITQGHHAYRTQTLVPARWRGLAGTNEGS